MLLNNVISQERAFLQLKNPFLFYFFYTLEWFFVLLILHVIFDTISIESLAIYFVTAFTLGLGGNLFKKGYHEIKKKTYCFFRKVSG